MPQPLGQPRLGLPAELGGAPARGRSRSAAPRPSRGGANSGSKSPPPSSPRRAASSSTSVSIPVPTLIAPGRLRLRRRQRRRDHVAHIYVVAGLAAVAEDRRPAALLQPAAEDRDHPGLAERVLARAVDVAEPQAHAGEAVEAFVERQVALGRVLALPVGGHRRDRRRLRQRQLLPLALAVDRAAGGDEDEAPCAGGARRLQHVGGAADVDRGVEGGVGDRLAHVDLGGEVEDRPRARPRRPGSATAARSRMSISTSRAPPASAPSRFSRRPVERSSTTVTASPRASRASTRFEPMKPAPPVTKQSMRPPILGGSARDRRPAPPSSPATLARRCA